MSLSLREVSQLLCQLKVLDQKITKVFEEQVGLSLTRYELLMILKERQPCLQTEIQEHLKIDSGAPFENFRRETVCDTTAKSRK